MWEAIHLVYKTHNDDPYNKEILIRHYLKHNADVIDYFGSNSSRLLVINLKDVDAGKRIADFLGSKHAIEAVPWENKI